MKNKVANWVVIIGVICAIVGIIIAHAPNLFEGFGTLLGIISLWGLLLWLVYREDTRGE
jgi:hypothetical protein